MQATEEPWRKRWNHANFSLEVRSQVATRVLGRGKDGGKRRRAGVKGHVAECSKEEEAKRNLQRGGLFTQVVGVLAAQEAFWSVLGEVKYARMLPCVCSGVRDLMQPKGGVLPFWGVWSRCMRRHTWEELCLTMNIKRKDLKHLKGVSEKVDPTNPCSKRGYCVQGVMEYMLREHGGYEGYAKSIERYRRNRKIHLKRRIAFATRMAGVYGVSGLVPGAAQEGGKKQAEPTKKKRESAHQRAERVSRERSEMRSEFGRVLCEEGGMSPLSFLPILEGEGGAVDYGINEEEEAKCTMRRWNTFRLLVELCPKAAARVVRNGEHRAEEVREVMIMGFCMAEYMSKVETLIQEAGLVWGGKRDMPLEWRMSATRLYTYNLCKALRIWFGGDEAREKLEERLSWIGDLEDPGVMKIVLRDHHVSRYREEMRRITKEAWGADPNLVEGASLPVVEWDPADDGVCPMTQRHGMARLVRLMEDLCK